MPLDPVRYDEDLTKMYEGTCNQHRAKHGLQPSNECEGACIRDCPLLKDEEVRV